MKIDLKFKFEVLLEKKSNVEFQMLSKLIAIQMLFKLMAAAKDSWACSDHYGIDSAPVSATKNEQMHFLKLLVIVGS